MLKQSNLFESLNFRYFGPVDGHDVLHLAEVLKDMKEIPGPKLLHVITQKGKGFAKAEENQTAFHSPGMFNMHTGEFRIKSTGGPQPPLYQDVFGETILELAKQNRKIIGITPAMPTGSSLKTMMDEMPDRTYDVGIRGTARGDLFGRTGCHGNDPLLQYLLSVSCRGPTTR